MVEFDNVTNDLCAFSVTQDKLPIMPEDKNGKNEIEKYEICKNKITVYTSRSIDDGTSVKIHFGANPEYVIMDRKPKYRDSSPCNNYLDYIIFIERNPRFTQNSELTLLYRDFI